MTTFNASSVLMPLDEYYKQCVEPKPITLRRSSYTYGNNPRRQAGHLRSYKDLDFPEEEEDDDEPVSIHTTRSESLDDIFASNEEDPNINQINFEMKDFDKLYSEETGTSSEFAPNSAQGSDNSSRSNVKSRLDLRAESRSIHYNRRPRNHQNWNNGQQYRGGGYRVQRPSMGNASMEQRMRNAYNAFSNNPEPRNDTQITVKHPKIIYPNQAASETSPQKNSVYSQVNYVSGPNIPDQRANNVGNSSFPQPGMFGQGCSGNQQPTEPKTEKKIEVLGDLIGMNPTENSNFNAREVARNVLLFLNTVSANEQQGPSQRPNWMAGNHRFN
ncbi:uncharacterized protein Boot isoform X1 [Drosophila bipectinata]|uniref:uncharacterized protein Boot isoform X1 n=1 Tax=Drosophila bipectinata TaxID=42026 RepID=UPI001C8A92A2|nr:uncharacterized protein LOC108123243 isoform X1 [Drosophila bipectinata]